jgi:hypothetical protein
MVQTGRGEHGVESVGCGPDGSLLWVGQIGAVTDSLISETKEMC